MHFLFLLFLMGLIAGCGGSGTSTIALKNLSSGAAATLISLDKALGAGIRRAAGDYGAAAVGSSGLESYKILITSIQFCGSITTTAGSSAYSGPTNCTTVYGDTNSDSSLSLSDAATASGYIDILSSADRSKLTKEVSLAAGTYNVAIVNWKTPIKMKAKVPLSGGRYLYTKTCPTTGACEVISDMATGPAEEAIFDSGNGGTWTKFLKPFVIASGDSLAVDLAFDLEQRLFGGDSISNGPIRDVSGCSAYASGYCGMYAPLLTLQPVPRKSTESTIVETYEMGGVSNEWKLRVDVYYNSADASKSVLAADIFPIPTASTNSSIAAGVYVYELEDNGGVIAFKDVSGSKTLSNFTRGDSGSATFRCPSGAQLAGCTGDTDVTVTWASRSVKSLVD